MQMANARNANLVFPLLLLLIFMAGDFLLLNFCLHYPRFG